MVVNPEPIKRIFTCYPFPSLLPNSSPWHRGWLFEALICDESCYYQLRMLIDSCSLYRGFQKMLWLPAPLQLLVTRAGVWYPIRFAIWSAQGKAVTCFSRNQPAELKGCQWKVFAALVPVTGVGQELTAQTAQLAGDLLHGAGQKFLPAGQRHVN